MKTFALSTFDNILPEKTVTPTVSEKPVDSDLSRAEKYAATFSQASRGNRNHTAYSHAARLREKFPISLDDLHRIMSRWNQGNTEPLGDSELQATVRAAEKYARNPKGSGYEPPKAPKSHTPKAEVENARQGEPEGIDKIIGDSITGKRNVVSMPWSRLTALTMALLSGTITFICGGIGARKSFLVLQVLLDFIQRNISVAVLWLEEDTAYYQIRALAQLTHMPELMSPEYVKNNSGLVEELMDEHRELVEAIGRCSWDFAHCQPTLEDVATWVETNATKHRILFVDPITAASRTSEPWRADDRFIQRIKRAAVDTGCSIISVTHSVKSMTSIPDLNMLAGSAAFGRFCQCALWLESHDPKNSNVTTSCGTTECEHNATFHILKSRNGPGTGLRIAMDAESLSLREVGIITKKPGDKK